MKRWRIYWGAYFRARKDGYGIRRALKTARLTLLSYDIGCDLKRLLT